MDQPTLHAELNQLSIAERILLVQDIWDSIAEEQQALKLSEAQKAELDRRLEAYRKSPQEGSTWDDVKQRILDAK